MEHSPALDEIAPPLGGGRYRLLAELGVGGMATVYRTWDTRLQVERAVKVLAPAFAQRPKARERFETEARLMARLHHPHIVTVHDVGHDPDPAGDRAYIVMELVPGGSLADRVMREGAMAPAQAAAMMRDVCRALEAAHEAGVIHRDVKPHNVLLDRAGLAKVTDFGIAHADSREISLTRTGAVLGTWAFMAPELRLNAKQADARSDLYAVGASLYMIATACQPLDLHASNVREHLLADVPGPLRQIIERATEYRPESRYASAAELAAALDAAIPALAGVAGPPLPLLLPGQGASPLTAVALASGEADRRMAATLAPASTPAEREAPLQEAGEEAGSEEAGSEEAGSEEAGSEEAGSEEAGS